MKTIEAHGAVIIHDHKLLATLDNKDPFYKIPGGKIKEGERGIDTAMRELTEETGLECIILGELTTQVLNKNPNTDEEMQIELHHYNAELKQKPSNLDDYDYNGHKVKWLDIDEIIRGRYNVAPNIKFLIEKGDIK